MAFLFGKKLSFGMFVFLTILTCPGFLFLTACQPNPQTRVISPQVTRGPVSVTPSQAVPTFLPTATPRVNREDDQTHRPNDSVSKPTSTPHPDTLAYLRSFPTFVAGQISTATLSSPEVCPPVENYPAATPVFHNVLDPTLEPNISRTTEEEVLSYLNQFGMTPLVGTKYSIDSKDYLNHHVVAYQDLTNDGIPELIIENRFLGIYGCKEGKIQMIESLPQDARLFVPTIDEILDLNRNGIPEMYLTLARVTQAGTIHDSMEWNGHEFQFLLYNPGQEVFGVLVFPGRIVHADTDGDDIEEVIAEYEIPIWSNYVSGLPWRKLQKVYKWNGKQFLYYRSKFDPPDFRFQAVQDGDRAMAEGDYERASLLYELVLRSKTLQAYSKEIHDTMQEQWLGRFSPLTPTPVFPAPDSREYDNLAAYARYRLMLLKYALGQETEGRTAYQALAADYPRGKAGHVFAGMAAAFQSDYEAIGDVSRACSRAIDFALNHWEAIAPYIGDTDYHGSQSLHYSNFPDMLCPLP